MDAKNEVKVLGVKDKVYLGIGDGGTEFAIVDEGYGPTIKITTRIFGNCAQEIKIHTDKRSLIELGRMFEMSSESNFSDEYVHAARVM